MLKLVNITVDSSATVEPLDFFEATDLGYNGEGCICQFLGWNNDGSMIKFRRFDDNGNHWDVYMPTRHVELALEGRLDNRSKQRVIDGWWVTPARISDCGYEMVGDKWELIV